MTGAHPNADIAVGFCYGTECLWLHGGLIGLEMDDLWRFDGKTQLWSKRTPSTSMKPPAMTLHKMVYDHQHHALWLKTAGSAPPQCIPVCPCHGLRQPQ